MNLVRTRSHSAIISKKKKHVNLIFSFTDPVEIQREVGLKKQNLRIKKLPKSCQLKQFNLVYSQLKQFNLVYVVISQNLLA